MITNPCNVWDIFQCPSSWPRMETISFVSAWGKLASGSTKKKQKSGAVKIYRNTTNRHERKWYQHLTLRVEDERRQKRRWGSGTTTTTPPQRAAAARCRILRDDYPFHTLVPKQVVKYLCFEIATTYSSVHFYPQLSFDAPA